MGKIRVLLVDDDEFLRECVRYVLDQDADIEFAGEAADGSIAIEMAQRLRPNVVVTDVDHPGADGFEVTRRVLEGDHEVKVLLYSAYRDAGYVERSLRLGARGYVLKGEPPSVLVRAIKTVAGGDFVSASVATRPPAGCDARLDGESASAVGVGTPRGSGDR